MVSSKRCASHKANPRSRSRPRCMILYMIKQTNDRTRNVAHADGTGHPFPPLCAGCPVRMEVTSSHKPVAVEDAIASDPAAFSSLKRCLVLSNGALWAQWCRISTSRCKKRCVELWCMMARVALKHVAIAMILPGVFDAKRLASSKATSSREACVANVWNWDDGMTNDDNGDKRNRLTEFWLDITWHAWHDLTVTRYTLGRLGQ